MVEVNWHVIGMTRIVHQDQPLDDVALDGVRQIVNGVGAVGKAEVDDGRGAPEDIGAGTCIAPEEIRCVKVIVRP